MIFPLTVRGLWPSYAVHMACLKRCVALRAKAQGSSIKDAAFQPTTRKANDFWVYIPCKWWRETEHTHTKSLQPTSVSTISCRRCRLRSLLLINSCLPYNSGSYGRFVHQPKVVKWPIGMTRRSRTFYIQFSFSYQWQWRNTLLSALQTLIKPNMTGLVRRKGSNCSIIFRRLVSHWNYRGYLLIIMAYDWTWNSNMLLSGTGSF